MSNPLQQQLDNMTPDQAIDLMKQTMSIIPGSRAEHLLLVKAEEMIVALVKKGLEAAIKEAEQTKAPEVKEPLPV
jgi:hypothetical protein